MALNVSSAEFFSDHAEGLVMLEAVEKNMEMFTKREIEKAQLARVVQR